MSIAFRLRRRFCERDRAHGPEVVARLGQAVHAGMVAPSCGGESRGQRKAPPRAAAGQEDMFMIAPLSHARLARSCLNRPRLGWQCRDPARLALRAFFAATLAGVLWMAARVAVAYMTGALP